MACKHQFPVVEPHIFEVPIIKKLFFFPLVNLSYISLIIRPAKELRTDEGNVFLSYTFILLSRTGLRASEPNLKTELRGQEEQ